MSIRDRLTDKQLEVFRFISEKITARGYGPTVREIGEHFNISSPNGVVCHLKALEKKGLIHRSPNKSRAIEISAEAQAEERGMPLAGRIAAGVMHEAIEQTERLDLERMFQREGLFALKVSGDSMIEAQIADGDYVIVEPRKTAKPGEMVVARTEEGEATLKYWHPEANRIRLQPANSSMQPIYVKSAIVVGAVVGVVRRFH